MADVLTPKLPNQLTAAGPLSDADVWIVQQGASEVQQSTLGGLKSWLGGATSWSGITDKPTTLAGFGITDAATAAQGALADTAVQPAGLSSALAGYQPLDGDLTAIAGLGTAAYGRGLLELENAAAGRAALGLGSAAVLDVGAAGGVAPLDLSGKIAEAHLPDSVLGQVEYQGTWTPATNTPALPVAAAANKGWYYIATADGTWSGIEFKTGDWVISSGSAWSKVDNTDAISTFNGRVGAIVPVVGDYSAFYQPLAGTLTSLAALATTAFGRGLLTETSASTLKGTLSLGSVENVALSTWAGSAALTTLGTIASGVWHGTAIADGYIASAAGWNAKANAFTLGNSLTFTGSVLNTVQDIRTSASPTFANSYFTGNVGIGTTSPTGKLRISGSAADFVFNLTGTEFYNTNLGTFKIYASHSAGALALSAGGRDIGDVFIASNGNVGIGTTSPTRKLVVAGGTSINYLQIDAAADQQAGIEITKGGVQKWIQYSPASSNDLRWYDGTSDRVTVRNGGNVGIGTTAPYAKLVISDSGAAGIEFNPNSSGSGMVEFYNRATAALFPARFLASQVSFEVGNVVIGGTTSEGYPLQIRRAGAAGSLGIQIDDVAGVTARAVKYYAVGDSTDVTTGHAFYTRNSTSSDTLTMLVNQLGVCIGTTTPASGALLTVAGNITSTGWIRTAAPVTTSNPSWRLGTAVSMTPATPNGNIIVEINGQIVAIPCYAAVFPT